MSRHDPSVPDLDDRHGDPVVVQTWLGAPALSYAAGPRPSWTGSTGGAAVGSGLLLGFGP